METGSILIREKRKHLTKALDRVSQMFWSASAQGLKGKEWFIEVYIHNQRIFFIIWLLEYQKKNLLSHQGQYSQDFIFFVTYENLWIGPIS